MFSPEFFFLPVEVCYLFHHIEDGSFIFGTFLDSRISFSVSAAPPNFEAFVLIASFKSAFKPVFVFPPPAGYRRCQEKRCRRSAALSRLSSCFLGFFISKARSSDFQSRTASFVSSGAVCGFFWRRMLFAGSLFISSSFSFLFPLRSVPLLSYAFFLTQCARG